MFLGTHTPRLDEKGRLFLPAKFRDELAEGLVVTRGQERCLYVWPAAEFRSLLGRHLQVVQQRSAPFDWLPVRVCFECRPRPS